MALAHGIVRGTATGRFYGAPATLQTFEPNSLDFVRVRDGLIVDRIQQADVFCRMLQLLRTRTGLMGRGAMSLTMMPRRADRKTGFQD